MTSVAAATNGVETRSTGNSPAVRARAIRTVPVLGLWLALVVITTSHHEFWRDEVRALSLARAASSPLDLYELVQYDGHPPLWHLLLYAGTAVVDTPLILPIASVLIALAAVTLFMVQAPFPFWFRCLFIFSALLVYEYAVMARNYGISVLLLFVAAALYRNRTRHPWSLAVALALLANTNVHSAIFAGLTAAVWASDLAARRTNEASRSDGSRYLPLGVVFVGLVACAAFTLPRENTVLTSVRRSLEFQDVAVALRGAVLRPDETFPDLRPAWFRPKPAILLLYVAVLGLAAKPNLLLAALAAQTALGVFFRVAYPGWYRHQGLYLMFLVFLYWLFIESGAKRARGGLRRVLFVSGLYVALPVLIAVDVSKAPNAIRADIAGAKSSSRALGRFLTESAEYRDAVIVPEPDFMLESLPYYAGNAIYLPRERRFGTTVSWTTESRPHLSLSGLLSAARDARTKVRGPVLIVLASIDPDRDAPGHRNYMYGKTFSWTAAEAEDFNASTTFLREFSASEGDEDYRVYVLP
jgi:hypothetical protein